MRRWLEGNLSPGSTPGLMRKQLFRLAAEECLITDVEAWFRYHELRNLTSHTYDSEVAAEPCATRSRIPPCPFLWIYSIGIA